MYLGMECLLAMELQETTQYFPRTMEHSLDVGTSRQYTFLSCTPGCLLSYTSFPIEQTVKLQLRAHEIGPKGRHERVIYLNFAYRRFLLNTLLSVIPLPGANNAFHIQMSQLYISRYLTESHLWCQFLIEESSV